MNRRQRVGRLGEQIARAHLEEKGYTILETNYRTREGEIDLIAEQNDEIIFVEVRTRRGNAFGTPEESMTPTKSAHLIAAAQEYLQATDNPNQDWRIDLIAIQLDPSDNVIRINTIENAIEL